MRSVLNESISRVVHPTLMSTADPVLARARQDVQSLVQSYVAKHHERCGFSAGSDDFSVLAARSVMQVPATRDTNAMPSLLGKCWLCTDGSGTHIT